MTTPGKAKLVADESARDLDAGLDRAAAGEHTGMKDEAQVEREPERDHDPAGDDETQRR
jgi:hypothetical protein